MSNTTDGIGSVVSLWRHPVKSMLGEELNATEVTERGVLGDRAYALIDPANGKVVSAKNPRKWGRLFDFRAVLVEPPQLHGTMPAVHITLPDGRLLSSEQSDLDKILSNELGHEVRFSQAAPQNPSLEEYWPDMEDLAHRETVTEEAMPPDTFFDCATVHVLSTATIDQLRALYPQGRFEVRRFRPNIVIEVTSGAKGFVENDWIGHIISIGQHVRLNITGPCPRCVMTTLPQGDLPKDPGILRTAAQQNQAHVGVYAAVVQGGTVGRGDQVYIQ
ncbi:MAG: MOSC domain-containing protein [Gammaproteobacteria bacterium]